jgi:hypothetical protein
MPSAAHPSSREGVCFCQVLWAFEAAKGTLLAIRHGICALWAVPIRRDQGHLELPVGVRGIHNSVDFRLLLALVVMLQ